MGFRYMYDILYALVNQPRGKGPEEGAPPGVASCGSDGSAHILQQVAPDDEEGPQQATSSSSTAGSRVLKLELHAEEEDSVSEVSNGNCSDAAVEDDSPIQLLNDLLL